MVSATISELKLLRSSFLHRVERESVREDVLQKKNLFYSPCKAVDADGVGDEGEAAEHRHGHSLHPEGERLRNEGWLEVILCDLS